MEEKNTRRVFDQEFKREAVRLVIEGKGSAPKIADDLGLNVIILYRWVHQFRDDPQNSFPGKGKLKPEDEEIRKLKRELADVKEGRDIPARRQGGLKKAVAIFSRARQ